MSNVRPRGHYLPKIVLNSTAGYHTGIDALVEEFRRCSVKFVGVVGVDCERIETIIDELVVGDASDLSWDLLTSSHPRESLVEAVAFARSLTMELTGDVQVVEV